MTSTALLVVAKAPEPGRAKTRLSPAVGLHTAAAIAAASLLDTLRAVAEVPHSTTFVAWTGNLENAVSSAEVAAALARTTVIPQRGEGLAERLAAAHNDVAEAVPGSPVLQIGMDTPHITSLLLSGSAAALHRPDGPDAVLGPAHDGGWWALGLRDPRNAELLRGVPMSAENTGSETLSALRSAGLTVDTLPPMSDVDTMEDAERVAAQIPQSRFAGAVHVRAGEVL